MKTPKELAEEYAKPLSKQGLPYIRLKDAFLAGYAAAMEQITTQEKQNETTKTR